VVDTGAAAVAEAEDSMVDTRVVAIVLLLYLEDTLVDTEVGIMVGIVEDTMAGSMVEVFTHIGDYGDGDIGDGLFWDGPMQVGPTCPMEDIRI
jgi:hypothetical protein